ncbi:hypothetical protein ACFY97_18705 [Streptomyces klenkii]|uniref:hypothetical protein n=1 Tax=Streptomyces klenkii TaxID=1420899 RepID=UPI0036ED1E01
MAAASGVVVMSPADRLLGVLNEWLGTTSSRGPVVARLEVITASDAALFAKLSLEQVDRLGHLLAVDDAVLKAHRAARSGDDGVV